MNGLRVAGLQRSGSRRIRCRDVSTRSFKHHGDRSRSISLRHNTDSTLLSKVNLNLSCDIASFDNRIQATPRSFIDDSNFANQKACMSQRPFNSGKFIAKLFIDTCAHKFIFLCTKSNSVNSVLEYEYFETKLYRRNQETRCARSVAEDQDDLFRRSFLRSQPSLYRHQRS